MDKRSSPPPPSRPRVLHPKYTITAKVVQKIEYTEYPTTAVLTFYDEHGHGVGTAWLDLSRGVSVYPHPG